MAKGTSHRFTSWKDKVSFNSAQQRSKASNYGHLLLPRGVPIFKEEPASRVSLDILPYIVTDPNHPEKDEERGVAVQGSEWYRRSYKLHRNIGAADVALVCPTSVGKKCPICEYRQNLLNRGANWQDDAVRKIRPSDRSIYYVVPIGHKKYEQRVHVWDISHFCFQSKLNDEIEENPDFGSFPDPGPDGLTLKIRFSEEKIGSNVFADTSRIDFEQRSYSYGEEDINNLSSLDEVIDVKDYAEIKRAFFETGDMDEDDIEEDEPEAAPRPLRTIPRKATNGANGTDRAPPPRRTRPPVEEAEEEVIEEGDVAEEPEEASPPPRRARTQPTAAAVEQTRAARPAPRPAATAAAGRAGAATAPTTRAPLQRQPLTRQAAPEAPAAAADACPAGYRFGVDCDLYQECQTCEVWNECYEAKGESE